MTSYIQIQTLSSNSYDYYGIYSPASYFKKAKFSQLHQE